jgi:hypothetical protein
MEQNSSQTQLQSVHAKLSVAFGWSYEASSVCVVLTVTLSVEVLCASHTFDADVFASIFETNAR